MKKITISFVILVIILVFIVIYYSNQNTGKNSIIQPFTLKEETNNAREESVNLWKIEGKRWDYRIGRTYWGFEPSFGKYLDSCGDNLNLYIIFEDNNTGYVISFDTILDKQLIKKWVTFDYTSYLIEQDGKESEALASET